MTMHKSMGHYLFIFVLGYIGISILTTVIGAFLSTSITGQSVLASFFAAIFTGGRFLKIEQRLPSDSERRTLTNMSFFIFAIINIILVGLIVLKGTFREIGELTEGTFLMMIGGAVALMFLISYLLIRWAYGKLLIKQINHHIKKDTTFD